MAVATKNEIDAAIAGKLLRLKPSRVDEDAIRSIVGLRVVDTLDAVAADFELSPNTIKQSWRSAGMPGESRRYDIAEILLWRLKYEASVDRGRSQYADLADRELDRKQKEAEARKIELQADRLEREEQTAMGNLVNRHDVVQAWSAMFAETSERLMAIPDDFAPELPVEQVTQVTERCRSKVSQILVRLSESGERAIRRLCGGADD